MDEQRQNRIRNLLAQPPVADRLLNMAWAFLSSRVLLYADELGLFRELAREPADLSTLCDRFGIDEDVASQFLTTLAGLGLIEQHRGLYRNAADVSLYLDPAKPSYIGNLLGLARSTMRDTGCTADSANGPRSELSQSSPLLEKMWLDIDGVLASTPLD